MNRISVIIGSSFLHWQTILKITSLRWKKNIKQDICETQNWKWIVTWLNFHYCKLYPNFIITAVNFFFYFKGNLLSILVQIFQCSHNALMVFWQCYSTHFQMAKVQPKFRNQPKLYMPLNLSLVRLGCRFKLLSTRMDGMFLLRGCPWTLIYPE